MNKNNLILLLALDAMNGKLLVTIQSNGKDEPVKVKLTSNGLEDCEVKF